MNVRKYTAMVEYTKPTMDTPFCTVQGIRCVTAETKESAVEQIMEDSYRRSYENFKVVSIEEQGE